MPFNSSDLVKRYTPPTCILEIYQKVFLIPLPNFSVESANMMFQLHFDDPRLPQEEKITIKGDRSLFKILTEEVNSYISEYLNKKTPIKLTESQENSLPFKSTEAINISLIENGLCHHQLYYSPDEKLINLTNTQLFDLANTLEKYQQESTIIYQKQINRYWQRISLVGGLLVLTSLIGGFLWWRNQEIITSQENEINQPIELNSENIKPNVQDVIPPSPLDPKTIPSIISPTETEAMKNRATLPPPPATLTQPPIPENAENLLNNSPTSLPIPPSNNQAITPINITPNNILPPPPSPPLPPPPSLPEMPNGNDNVIAINPNPKPISKPSLPKPAPINNPTPSFVNNNPQSPPRLSSLPVLQSANSQSQGNNIQTVENDTNSVAINTPPNLIPNQTTTTTKNTSTPTTEEIKQYFQKKWQPPDNLTQSIEYRLLINQNGSLIRITPLGQTSQVFLDRTGMPLLGETISSPSESVIVRLILSPNGDVKTFQE